MEIKEYIKSKTQEIEESIMSHYTAGVNDCKLGIYDKWFRYNASDEGEAYDMGWTEQNKITQNEEVYFVEQSSLF